MKVLCYVNHYFGQPVGFEGRSTDGDRDERRAIVERCVEGLRRLPGVVVQVCGIEGRSLLPIDLDFSAVRADPKLLVYESLAHMTGRLDEFDYFVNVEDDILVPPETLANVVEFDRDSFPNEVLHPNRLEMDATGEPFCVDLRAMPGWIHQRRTHRGRELRVARNPHSAVLILSRDKFRYALRHVDPAYRGRFLNYEMDSAFAWYHSPLSLYRPYDDLAFHTVTHLDQWAGARAPKGATAPLRPTRPRSRWRSLAREFVPPILVRVVRRLRG
jgi:hypothetical protein